jgi:hypothetical protein
MSALVDGRPSLKAVNRWAKMALFRSIGRSDYERWADADNLEAWWESRTRKLAGLVPAGTRVVEFGAGSRALERCLDASCTYMASDLVDRGPGTFICDLNRRPLPDLGTLRPEVAVFAGVLEYVRDVPTVVAWLARQVRFCAASYAVADRSGLVRSLAARVKRTYYGYMNAYNETDIVAVFRRGEFACIQTDSWNDQRLFLFEKQSAETRP